MKYTSEQVDIQIKSACDTQKEIDYNTIKNIIISSSIDDLIKLGEFWIKRHSEDIILAPTSRLEFVPRSVADFKIQQLGKAIEKLQDK